MLNTQRPLLKRDALKDGWTSCFRCGGKGHGILPHGDQETCHVCNGYGLLHPSDMQRFTYMQETDYKKTGAFNDEKIEEIAKAELAKKKGRPAKNNLVGLD